MITKYINEIVSYGRENGLIEFCDEIYVTNRLLELFGVMEYCETERGASVRAVHEILEDMMAYALAHGILKEDTITMKDLFDTKIMGCLTPAPSVVRKKFKENYEISPQKATDYYY